MKKIVSGVAVILFSMALFGAAFAKDGGGPGSSASGGNSGHGGGSSHGGGIGGGDGGHGGSHGGGGGEGHGGGSNGGGNGNGNGGGDNGGGSTAGGGSTSPAGVSVSGDAGASGPSGATGVLVNGGFTAKDREHLDGVIRMCENTRPGLAIGRSTVNGYWSFITFDDTIWRFVQMCMADHGYPANGPDYRKNPVSFAGPRVDGGVETP